MALILVRNANRAVCGVYTHGWRWERALEQGRKRVRWKEGPSPTSSAITCKGDGLHEAAHTGPWRKRSTRHVSVNAVL
jgi:hypothetical protein